MKPCKYIIFSVILVAIVAIYIYINERKKNEGWEVLRYRVPLSPDPNIFGKHYWAAFHDLSHQIPCGGCRTFAERFMVYFHDLVNKKLNKPLFDEDNYNYFNTSISKLNSGLSISDAFSND